MGQPSASRCSRSWWRLEYNGQGEWGPATLEGESGGLETPRQAPLSGPKGSGRPEQASAPLEPRCATAWAAASQGILTKRVAPTALRPEVQPR